MLGDAGIDGAEDVLFVDGRKYLLRLFLLLALESVLETLLNRFPAFLSDRFTLCLELIAFAGECDRSLIIDVLLSGGRQKAHGNETDDLLL